MKPTHLPQPLKVYSKPGVGIEGTGRAVWGKELELESWDGNWAMKRAWKLHPLTLERGAKAGCLP